MDQKNLIQEMSKAVYRHTSLYVEADKQAVSGKRRKSPEYVKKRIKNNLKKIAQDKKVIFWYYISNPLSTFVHLTQRLCSIIFSFNSLIDNCNYVMSLRIFKITRSK